MPVHLTADAARALHDALVTLPGVAGLYPGRYGEISLLLPGKRVPGIRYTNRDATVSDPTGLEIHIIIDIAAGINAFEISNNVRAQALALTDAEFVDVIVADACDSSSPSADYESAVQP